jgi:nucleoside-diphosphate-sugar epimerase
MKKKIFCTGASGFIGKYLSERLLKQKDEVYGLFTPNDGQHLESIAGVQKCEGNLLDYKRIGKILREVNPDIIIHLAARTEVEKSFYDPISFSEINYCGTVNLIECAKENNNLKQFIFASTMETYGEVYTKEDVLKGKNLHPFTEYTPQKPNAPYAVAKVGCEKYLEYAGRAYDFPYVILRQTNTYGRWDNDFFVTEQIITQMLRNAKEINLGYKEPYRNFLFIEDLIDLYITIIKQREVANGHIFCTGPDNAIRIEDFVNKIAKMIGWNGKINWDTKPKRVGEVYYLNSTNKKATEKLGWKPKHDLGEGLKKTIEIWRKKIK